MEECPRCGLKDIKKGKLSKNGRNFSQMFKCKNCGNKWAIDINFRRDKT